MYLTNVTNTYDHYCFEWISRRLDIQEVEDTEHPLSMMPYKSRYKLQPYLKFHSDNLLSLLSFFEHIPEFRSLSNEAKKTLVQRNLRNLLRLNTTEPIRSGYFVPPASGTAHALWEYIFGEHMLNDFGNLMIRYRGLLKEPIFTKMLLVIMVFSSHFSVTRPNDVFHVYACEISSYDIFQLQSFYTTLLWKYLIYRLGEVETIQVYTHIIGLCLKCVDMGEQVEKNFIDREELNEIVKLTQTILLV
ncbi:unnamed protein product [Didymodactylos carnosus]|nr:unnamed protein product [Didymodactylos carnosus]CAF4040105.1 unnamed protein product [Didymodactylos carnosus]